MDDINIVVPRPATLVVAGETVAVCKLKFGQIPAFAAVVGRPWLLLVEGNWLEAAVAHNADMAAALAMICDRPKDWLLELSVEDFVLLSDAAFGMNMDFFARAVIPAVQKAAQGLVRAGSGFVTPSSVPDTASPTS